MSKFYDSLFNGTKPSLPKHLQEEEARIEKEELSKVLAMTEEEKIKRFNEIMGR